MKLIVLANFKDHYQEFKHLNNKPLTIIEINISVKRAKINKIQIRRARSLSDQTIIFLYHLLSSYLKMKTT
jgi:hypothetical protein